MLVNPSKLQVRTQKNKIITTTQAHCNSNSANVIFFEKNIKIEVVACDAIDLVLEMCIWNYQAVKSI